MLRTHHLPCHILIVILYVICPTCCKNYYQSLRWHLRQQIFAITTLIDRFTSDISIAYDSAVAPPVRMGLTNLLVGKYLHEKAFAFM